MKKIFLSLMVFSLVFVYGGISLAQDLGASQTKSEAPVQQNALAPLPLKGQYLKRPEPPKATAVGTSSLEKISYPGEISLFQKIIKIGTALWGERKDNVKSQSSAAVQASNQPVVAPSNQTEVAPAATTPLEKISNPAEISLFDKIKKIGTALWGVRKGNVQVAKSKWVYITPAAAPCVKIAIDKKDTTLKTSETNHSQKVITIIDKRGTCQKTALDQTTAQSQFNANQVCINVFQKAINEINAAMNKEKNEALKIFHDDLKACSALQTVDASTTSLATSSDQIIIEDGGNMPVESNQ